MPVPLTKQSISQLGQGLRSGAFSAVTLTTETLTLIDALNPTIHAFVAVTRERAMTEARRADADLRDGLDRGPLHGIPYALKDIFDAEGSPTTAQSHLLLHNVASADAEVVARLSRAGAVLVGKAATYEFAIEPWPGSDTPFAPARNPHHPDHITGGSSSGSAAAVAAGMVRIALGSDTGGSVRSPAGYCGVVGLKPGFGRVPTEGMIPLSPSLDHVGVLAASVEDAALALDAISIAREARTTSASTELASSEFGRGVDGLRIAYARNFFVGDAPLEHLAALDDAAERLAQLGAEVVEVELPPYDLFESCGRVILQAEAYALHAVSLRTHGGAYGRLAFQSLVVGAALSSRDLLAAQRAKRHLSSTLDRLFDGFDAMLTANVLATAPRFDEIGRPGRRWTPMRTFPFNVSGHPALALPTGTASDSLPIGVQLVGPANGEAMLCRVAAALERDLSIGPAVSPPPAAALREVHA